jgi:hypothetical protein
MVDNLRGEFDPHRYLRREASVRQYNGAGMFCTQFYLRAEHVLLIYNSQRKASVRQYNGAGMFCPQFYLRAEHVLLIYNAQINCTLLTHFYTVGLPK